MDSPFESISKDIKRMSRPFSTSPFASVAEQVRIHLEEISKMRDAFEIKLPFDSAHEEIQRAIAALPARPIDSIAEQSTIHLQEIGKIRMFSVHSRFIVRPSAI